MGRLGKLCLAFVRGHASIQYVVAYLIFIEKLAKKVNSDFSKLKC